MNDNASPKIDSKGVSSIVKRITGYNGEINSSEPLKKYGMDSLGNVELIVSLEEMTGISIPDDKLNPENFGTIDSILSLMKRLKDEK